MTQHGSLRRASEQLHISQPALSEAVTKLEHELGVTLLDRRRSGARISHRGGELQPYMVGVLEAVDPAGARGPEVPRQPRRRHRRGAQPAAARDRPRPARGHPLTAYDEVSADHFVHWLFGPDMPSVSYTTDGAELGKVMVAEGLGPTVLPDYSVIGDPMERAGLITYRPLAGDRTSVSLVLRQRRQQHVPRAVRDLETALLTRARAHRPGSTGTDLGEPNGSR